MVIMAIPQYESVVFLSVSDEICAAQTVATSAYVGYSGK
jgi:hypothetical protein